MQTSHQPIRWSRIVALILILLGASGLWFYSGPEYESLPRFLLIGGLEAVLVVYLIFLVTAPLSPQRRNSVFVGRPIKQDKEEERSTRVATFPETALIGGEASFDHRRPNYDEELYAREPAMLLCEYAALAS